MALYVAGVVCLMLAALSLAPSHAHVLEALPRPTVWRLRRCGGTRRSSIGSMSGLR